MAVDAERGDVVEPPHDAGQVADAVAVAVLKGARIDLIDHPAAPPFPHPLPPESDLGRGYLYEARDGIFKPV